ncbi:MAG: methylthioribulose 1-phosphate dehydratase [Prochloraceae cyanobacterium]
MSDHPLRKQKIDELRAIADWIGSRGWCPATGGNFSSRLDENYCLVTASGVDKTALQENDFLLIDLTGKVHAGQKKPSAETPLHTTLYTLAEAIDTVLHTHTVSATVLSTYFQDRNSLIFHGYEMQKSLSAVTTHEAKVCLPIFNNNQNIPLLAEELKQRWHQEAFSHGFLVRGHGLYAWGTSVSEAKRHLEGLEFLLSCELNRMLLEVRR